MPYTAQQRRYFHFRQGRPGGGLSGREAGRLASEADRLAGEGREKRPARPKAAGPGSIIVWLRRAGRALAGRGSR